MINVVARFHKHHLSLLNATISIVRLLFFSFHFHFYDENSIGWKDKLCGRTKMHFGYYPITIPKAVCYDSFIHLN